MYFQKFPKAFYTLDNGTSVQIITNILQRVVLTDELQNNYSVYDEYDITDSDTPENLAYQVYGDSGFHWILLHFNNILDPRFEWPQTTNNLVKYVEGKYPSINGIHHYEDSNQKETNGNVILNASLFNNIEAGNAIINLTQEGTGFITSKPSNTTIVVTTTKGGFRTGDQVALASNTSFTANITSTTINSGVAVTNLIYEDRENEKRRRIKLLKPQFIERIVREFESKMALVDG